MEPDEFGYVVCPDCHGSFHEDDMRAGGKCWLCTDAEGQG